MMFVEIMICLILIMLVTTLILYYTNRKVVVPATIIEKLIENTEKGKDDTMIQGKEKEKSRHIITQNLKFDIDVENNTVAIEYKQLMYLIAMILWNVISKSIKNV